MKRRIPGSALRRAFVSGAALATLSTVLVLTTATASAQDGPPPPPSGQGGPGFQFGPGGVGGPAMGPMQRAFMSGVFGPIPTPMLLGRPDVSRDIGFTQEQRAQLQEARMKAMQSNMPPPPADGGFPDAATMRKANDKVQAELAKALDKILTSDQKTRLKEIKVQMSGSSAVLDKEIAVEVGVSAVQQNKIDEIVKLKREKFAEQPKGFGVPGGPPPVGGPGLGGPGGPPPPGGPGFGGPGGPPPGGGPGFGGPGGPPPAGLRQGPGSPRFGGPNPEMEKAKKDLNDAIDVVLTESQRAALKKMAGTKKFVEQQPRMRPGFGSPGGPGRLGPPPPDDQFDNLL